MADGAGFSAWNWGNPPREGALARVHPLQAGAGASSAAGRDGNVRPDGDESAEQFRALAESLPQLVWAADGAGRKTYCNQRYLEYVGVESLEQMDALWYRMVHPEDREATVAAWTRSVQTGVEYLSEYRLRRNDGVYRHFLARALPMRGKDGRVLQWLGTSTDVHDQKLAEEALRRAEKLATAGRLASSIAHEINNPLASVTNSLFLALSDETLSGETRQYLDLAEQELRRVAHVTTQTLRFHRQSSAASSVEPRNLVESVYALFERRFRSAAVQVDREYENCGRIHVYADELRQLLAILFSNALDAIPQGGKLKIRVGQRPALGGGEKRGVRILLADTGCGIPANIQARLFEPFVTSKGDTGTGLGLWVADGIIRKHGGRMRVRSRIGRGTVVSVFLPYRGVAAIE